MSEVHIENKVKANNNDNVPFIQYYAGGASRRSLRLQIRKRQHKKRSAHPFALPKSSSNRALKSSNAESNLSPYTCPLSILNASHSRMNCSRSFTRAMDSSGSLEPRARARYEATMVDSPPVYAIRTHICGSPLCTRKNEIKHTQNRSRNRRLSAYMRSNSVQRPTMRKGKKSTCRPLVTAANPVVKDPRRTWSPIAALRAYPVIFALNAHLSRSEMAVMSVGSSRSPMAFCRKVCYETGDKQGRHRWTYEGVNLFVHGDYPVNA